MDQCHSRVRNTLVLLGICSAAVVCATPACADDNQYLADLKQPGMVHPAMSDQELLVEGRQVCFEVGKVGISPDAAKSWVSKDLDSRGLPSDYATAGTLVHYALHDLCPNVPNSSGI
ncbi:DUF732 domain-containing protein [Mycobacterium sp. 1482292.6]|uniref:DUF732 domain-containing protein n=1 Tax=Mycobacterium sp. 1482292.6 TaxID=1834081 RepID=UPI0009F6FFFE